MYRVFVYGTLKRGFFNHERVFSGSEIDISDAWTWGKLYDLGLGFPGMMVRTVHKDYHSDMDKVYGELVQFQDSGLLKIIDRLEGFKSPGNRFNLYDRIKKEVYVQNKKLEAWVYVINPNQATRLSIQEIPTGIWI